MALSAKTLALHRTQLMALMAPNSIAIIPAASEQTRSRDTQYTYRQNSDFYYLSGFDEPDSLLVLAPGRPEGEFILFCRERNKDKEIWEGIMAGPEGAKKDFAADESFTIEQADKHLPKLMDGCQKIYYPVGQNAAFDAQVIAWLNTVRAKARAGAQPPEEFASIDALIHNLRLIKGDEEIALMEASCALAAKAHVRAMEYCKPGVWEYQLEAEIMHTFAMNNARSAAYNTIVGGGVNACILHYTNNNQALKAGDLVLIDAGCELDFYAADITRTFPVSGKFSAPQKALYELTLKAQAAALAAMVPGRRWNESHEASVQVITQGLIDLGLLKGDTQELIKTEAYKRFYMHKVGHWLGMDVHDVGAYKVDGQWRILEAGMTMTVEPGIYVQPDDETVDEKWRGIGIRIEDDVLITPTGNKVLTRGVPKTIEAIEALMSQ